MKSFCHRIAAVVGLGLLSSGCIVDSLDDELAAAPPRSTLEGPGGTSGNNGLPPSIYHSLRTQLDQRMQHPLFIKGVVNPGVTTFLGTEDGERVFGYAVGCAFADHQSVLSFPGSGLIATAGSWLTSGLTQQQRDDVHTCITTRLNPEGVTVPIWIGGPDTVKNVNSSSYEFFEAVWSVTMGPTSWTLSVWPSNTFQMRTDCDTQLEITSDFESRICDNNPSLCNITPRTDMSTACTGQPGEGNWVCDGKPAIETRLNLDEWNALHPLCEIRPSP